MTPSNPILRYHGGKWRCAPWVISHFPPHDVYVEPFGGAASVLIRKPRSRVEVYNDAYGRVVNLFRVLRDPVQSLELARLAGLTPYAEEEFKACLEASLNPVEDARRMLVLSLMSRGNNGSSASGKITPAWRRQGTKGQNGNLAMQWAGIPEIVVTTAARFTGVFCESADALDIIRRWDAPKALIYCDPPYAQSTRKASTSRRGYDHEYTDADHKALLNLLLDCKGRVALSGYANPLYDEALSGWRRFEHRALADNGASRTEVLWTNYTPPGRLGLEG